jgi:hypothetical protein
MPHAAAPAKAGAPAGTGMAAEGWIPAFAGMTEGEPTSPSRSAGPMPPVPRDFPGDPVLLTASLSIGSF